jgi:hypothetical protein
MPTCAAIPGRVPANEMLCRTADDRADVSAKDEARDPFGREELKGISQPTPGMNAKQIGALYEGVGSSCRFRMEAITSVTRSR